MKPIAALGIFVVVYATILAGENSPRKLDRPAAGLLGAVLMVVCGVLTRAQALAAIDFSMLALLFGMMVLIHGVSASGLVTYTAGRVVARGFDARRLLWIVCLAAGLMSALFVNDTVCLLMTPLLLAATERAGLPAEPYLLALATSSNVGSVMTITGNPQNMLIGQASGWSWGGFALRMTPIGLACLTANALILERVYRRELQSVGSLATRAGVSAGELPDPKRAVTSAVVLAGVLLAFVAGAPMDVAALTGAVALLVLMNRPPSEAFAGVDWTLLLFFAGLFVVVEGVTRSESATISRIVPVMAQHHGRMADLLLVSLASVAGSNLFSNVPYVMLLRGWIGHMPHARLLWLVLSASSTFAGNLTLVGSAANLIVAQGAKDKCPLSPWTFMRVGAISVAVNVIISVCSLYVFRSVGWI